jgi:hypothetical protein
MLSLNIYVYLRWRERVIEAADRKDQEISITEGTKAKEIT